MWGRDFFLNFIWEKPNSEALYLPPCLMACILHSTPEAALLPHIIPPWSSPVCSMWTALRGEGDLTWLAVRAAGAIADAAIYTIFTF